MILAEQTLFVSQKATLQIVVVTKASKATHLWVALPLDVEPIRNAHWIVPARIGIALILVLLPIPAEPMQNV
jgi:hypothetical protein